MGQSGGVSPTCLPPAFPSPPHPYTTPCPLSSSVFSLVPFLFLSLSLSVLSGCGVWFMPRVCHTPPTHSLCLVLAAPPFLPLASTSLSLLSSSSSSCCCGFVWVLLFVTPPLCFLACLWCVVVWCHALLLFVPPVLVLSVLVHPCPAAAGGGGVDERTPFATHTAMAQHHATHTLVAGVCPRSCLCVPPPTHQLPSPLLLPHSTNQLLFLLLLVLVLLVVAAWVLWAV